MKSIGILILALILIGCSLDSSKTTVGSEVIKIKHDGAEISYKNDIAISKVLYDSDSLINEVVIYNESGDISLFKKYKKGKLIKVIEYSDTIYEKEFFESDDRKIKEINLIYHIDTVFRLDSISGSIKPYEFKHGEKIYFDINGVVIKRKKYPL